MDKRAEEYIKKNIAPDKATMRKLYREETPMKADKEKLQEVLSSKLTTNKDRKIIEGVLRTGGDRYDRKTLVLNEKAAKEESKRVEGRIKAAIERGDLPKYDPKKDKQAQQWIKKSQR